MRYAVVLAPVLVVACSSGVIDPGAGDNATVGDGAATGDSAAGDSAAGDTAPGDPGPGDPGFTGDPHLPTYATLQDAADNLPAGRWTELAATNNITDVFPAQAGHPAWAVVGPSSVVTAWSGGAVGDGGLYIWGGGHNDYGGNEVYRFRFADFTWERLTDPSPYQAGCSGICVTSDGTPTSVHSYDGVAWLPVQHRLWTGSGSGYQSGSAPDQSFLFDPIGLTWTPITSEYTGWLFTDLDPLTGFLLVGSNSGGLGAYDPATDTYRHQSGINWSVSDRSGALDPITRRFVVLAYDSGSSYDIAWFDLSGVDWGNPSSSIPWNERAVTTIGGVRGEPPRMGRMGLEFDPDSELLVAWDGGPSVWTLDSSSWEWTELTTIGDAPSAFDGGGGELTRGVYGRWRYLADYGVFLGYNDPDGAPWLFKMP